MKKILKTIVVGLLTVEAKLALRKYKPKIVAITGSVGKTSAKDAIYSVLSEEKHARKSEKSFNSEIGVPLTILGCPNAWNNPLKWFANLGHGLALILFKSVYPEILILEVGADRKGDIFKLAKWLKPDVSVITRLADIPVHVEFFSSPEEMVEEKFNLLKFMKADGTAVLCADDDKTIKAQGLVRGRSITFGMDNPADVRGEGEKIFIGQDGRPAGFEFAISSGGETGRVILNGTVGRQVVYAALVGVSVGRVFNIPFGTICVGLSKYVFPSGRMRLIAGIKESVILDDSYNSSPVACHSALGVLKSLEFPGIGKRIAVLGDMMELGKYSIDEHRKIGNEASFVDLLIVVGPRAKDIAAGAVSAGLVKSKIKSFGNSVSAGKFLSGAIGAGDIILLKGSQSVRMEKAVKMIMNEPEKAGEFLVRQDEEWMKR